MIRALFICSRNRLRSPTAEQLFGAWPGVQTDSAGLAADAEVRLSAEQLDWATLIFVMEKAQRSKLQRQYRRALAGKRVICLDIADDYAFMQAQLQALLHSRVGRYLR
ncbi:phosphotyrosine protein phosphatase [Pseudomonas sp. AOB-7]|uniref:low molecular weight protein tyrosine phosphatase family protein n=1 Tax=Pseudomonas sp. AOB-7 TaxID=2482750 RepID=UPI000EFAF88D|nr:low molecular weight protein tyrosine phosphatase family protein [Pseudomonas sp. AOB-7]RMH86472.1 phosphotyrosine protein phosphatase [Pseudomonas sp. AOB-7]